MHDVDYSCDAIFRIADGEIVMDATIAEHITAAVPIGLSETKRAPLSLVGQDPPTRPSLGRSS